MEASLTPLENIITLKQDLLGRIEELVSKEPKNAFGTSEEVTRTVIQKKLKTASKQYKIMRPIVVVVVLLFLGVCLAQIGEFNFFFKWEKAALLALMTFSLTFNISTLKRQIERYEQLLYLVDMLERLEKLEGKYR